MVIQKTVKEGIKVALASSMRLGIKTQVINNYVNRLIRSYGL